MISLINNGIIYLLQTNSTIQPQIEATIQDDNLRLLSINQVREILKVRHETVKKLIDEGKIEVVLIGKRVKIPKNSIPKYIEENTVRLNNEVKEQNLSNSRSLVNHKIDSIIKKHMRKY